MTVSQNGYQASPDRAAIGIVDAVIPGTSIRLPGGVKGGDVATILLYVAAQFHATVESIDPKNSGGYLYRVIAGSNVFSNHASGTAFDFNWNKHPLGARGTFTSAQVSRIRSILAFCEGIVRWGGDYSTRKDEMHFEIKSITSAASRIAQKIRNQKTPVQPLLKEDGVLGDRTISKWQQVMGTPVDGVISVPSALVAKVQARLKATVDSNLIVDGKGIYQDGKRYRTAGALQRYLGVPVDEIISTPESETIRALQHRLNQNRF